MQRLLDKIKRRKTMPDTRTQLIRQFQQFQLEQYRTNQANYAASSFYRADVNSRAVAFSTAAQVMNVPLGTDTFVRAIISSDDPRKGQSYEEAERILLEISRAN